MNVDERPISHSVRKVLSDPATNKLLIIVSSVILLITVINNNVDAWNVVPLLLLYSISLGYSFMALLVVAFDEKNKLQKNLTLQRIFCGRPIHWHEIQSTMAFTLAFANIPWISWFKIAHWTQIITFLSVLNSILFILEYKAATTESQKFAYEENIPQINAGCGCLLKTINRFSLFGNLIRIGCVTTVLYLIIKNQNFDSSMNFVIYCCCVAFAGSFMILVLQFSAICKSYNITELEAKDKWITNSLLTVTLHAALAILSFSLVIGNYEERLRTHQENENAQSTTSYTTLSYPQIEVNGNYYYQIFTPFYAPMEAPIAYSILCGTFILSGLALYSSAIHSKSRFDTESPIYRKGIITV